MKSLFQHLPFRTRGYIALLGSFLLHIILGTFYLWSDLNSYITSNLRLDGQNYNKNDTNQIFPFMILSINIGTLFSVKLAQKIGMRIFACIFSFLLALSIFVSSYFLLNFTLFALFYGFSFGLTSGLLYMLPFNICYVYFSNKKGLVSGVISAGFGFGSTIFIQIVYLLVNPNNIQPQKDPSTGESYYGEEVCKNLPRALRILGIVYCAGAIIGSLLLEDPSKEEREEALTEKQTLLDQSNVEECQKVKDGLKTPFIYISLFLVCLYASYGAMVVANFKSYGEQLEYSDKFLTIVGTLGSLCNGFSRVFWGWVFQKMTFRKLISFNLIIQAILSSTFKWAGHISGLFLVYVCLGYFIYGGFYAIMPALVSNIYGKQIGTKIYGITFCGFTIACFLQFFTVKYLQETLGWETMFFIFTGIQIFSLIISQFIKFYVDWKKFYQNKNNKFVE